MPNKKTEDFLQKLMHCIECGEIGTCVNEAVRLAQDMEITASELLTLSSKYRKYGNNDLEYLLALTAIQKSNGMEKAKAFNKAGRAARAIHKLKEAEEHYLNAIKINPNDECVHNGYAFLLYDMKRYDEAEKYYLKAIEINPKHEYAHNNYANLLKDLERYDEAEKHYLKAIEINPKDEYAYGNYANLLNDLERYDEAETYYLEDIKINPKKDHVFNNYANMLHNIKKYDVAEKYYLKTIEINPKHEHAHNNYANLLKTLKRYDEAEVQYIKAENVALNLDPRFLNDWASRSKVSVINKKDKGCHSIILKHTPKLLALVYYNYGGLLSTLNRVDEAEEKYKKAIRTDQEYAAAYAGYANLLANLDRNTEAEIYYKTSIKLDPTNDKVLHCYANFLYRLEYFDKSQTILEKINTK